jgi:hypothetical protein
MRLQELFESSEEDRALISLSSAIYSTIKTHDGDLGTIGDLYDTSIPVLNNVSISVKSGNEFLEYATGANNIQDHSGKKVYSVWDADTNSIVFNKDLMHEDRMKTSVTHELRHALDEIKSGSYKGGGLGYFTPKKKEHRDDETTKYRAQPAEINARFSEILHKLTDIIPKRKQAVEPAELKNRLMHDLNHLLVKYEIADLFPEKTQSRDYKRLINRAYDFINKETAMLGL